MNFSIKNKLENRFMIIIIILSIILFFVFFTSKYWLYDDDPKRQTPFNETITALNQYNLKLSSWKYNKNDKFMEVIINKEKTGDDVINPDLNFKALEYEGEEINIDIPFENENLIVLKLRQPPLDFKYIELEVEEVRDEETVKVEETEFMTDLEKESEEFDLPSPEKYSFFGDYREIKIDNNLVIKSKNEYEKEEFLKQKDIVSNEIKFIEEEKIPLEAKVIIEIESDIEDIKKEKEFMTEIEKEETETEIEEKENEIKNILENITSLEEDIKDLKEKEESYQKRINSLGKD